MQRITVTLDDELVAALDQVDRGARLSEPVGGDPRSRARRARPGRAGSRRPSARCVAALVYVYDHEGRELAQAPDPLLSRSSRSVAGDDARASRPRELHGGRGPARQCRRDSAHGRPSHLRARRSPWPRHDDPGADRGAEARPRHAGQAQPSPRPRARRRMTHSHPGDPPATLGPGTNSPKGGHHEEHAHHASRPRRRADAVAGKGRGVANAPAHQCPERTGAVGAAISPVKNSPMFGRGCAWLNAIASLRSQ